MNENELSNVIISAAIEVHRVLGGPGLLEDVYEEALVRNCVCGASPLSGNSRFDSNTKDALSVVHFASM